MRRHTFLFFLSCVLSLSLVAGSLFYGGKVKASSPVFYDATYEFYLPSRLFSRTGNNPDFQYNVKTFNEPIFNGAGDISDMYILPASAYTSSSYSYSTVPFYISVTSPDLLLNGGRIFLAFVLAWSNLYNSGNFTFDNTRVSVYKSRLGAVTNPDSQTTTYDLTYTSQLSSSIANTGLSYDFLDYQNPVFAQGFGSPNTENFPVAFGKLEGGGTSQLLESLGKDGSVFYYFGTTHNSWNKTSVIRYVVDVPAQEYLPQAGGICIYFNFTPCFSGSFKAISSSVYIQNGDDFETINLGMQKAIYVCPVYAFCISSTYYEPIESLLTNIDNNLQSAVSSLGYLSQAPSSEQIAWLNEYQRKTQNAVSKASSMADAAHYDFSKPNIDSGDLSQYINGTEVRPFTTLLSSFLSHSKILIILTIAITASIIGYIFFGKRG